jgi:hypothetical protein
MSTDKSNDVVGGPLDGQKHQSGLAWFSTRDGKTKYVALRFAIDPADDKSKEVTIYMVADDSMSAIDAMRIWRKRQKGELVEEFVEPVAAEPDKLVAMAKQLINSNPVAVGEYGPEEFCEMCEVVCTNLMERKVFVGRGALVVQLEAKVKEIRAAPDRYSPGKKPEAGSATATTKASAPPPSRPIKQVTGRVIEPHPNPMGALPVPIDPDDEPW